MLQLLGSNADISKQNCTGCDAAWVAAAYGKRDVLQLLLASGGSASSCSAQVTRSASLDMKYSLFTLLEG